MVIKICVFPTAMLCCVHTRGNLRAEDLFGEVRTFMFGTMRDAYDVMREAWRELITTHVQKPSSLHQTLVSLTHVVGE